MDRNDFARQIEDLQQQIAALRQAEERARLQAARTTALVRTAARLNVRLDLDAVLRAVCEETAKALEIPVVTVSLYDAQREALIPTQSIGLPDSFTAQAEPLPRHIVEDYIQQMGHLVVIPDVQVLTDLPNAELYRAFDVRTTVSISMLREGQLIGRLNVGSLGEVRNFNPNELALLQGLADQAAQAIANAREVQERQRAEETLRKSQMQLAEAQKIAHIGSWEWDIASNVVTWSDETYRTFGFQPGAFPVTYEKFLELVHPDDREFTDQMIQKAYQTHRPYNFYHRIVRPDGSVRINQARGNVVLDNHGNVVGMVGTGQDVTELKQAEAQLERHTQNLEAIGQMGLAVTATLDLALVLKRVLEQIAPLVPAEGISILLLEGDELLFAATAGLGASSLEGQRMPATAGVAGAVIDSGRPVWIMDRDSGGVDADDSDQAYARLGALPADSPLQLQEATTGYRVCSLLAVPLKLHGKVAGVIEAAHSQPEIFNAQDLQLLEAAASWTAIAIGNAHQHEQIRKRLQESESLAAISQALNETLDQERILQGIVQAARQIITQADDAIIHLFDDEVQGIYPEAATGLDDRKLVAPIKSSSRYFGTISVVSDRPDVFSGDDERVLTTLGVQAALAIQNTRLYEALGEEKRRLELLYSLSHNLGTTLNPRTVATRALNLAMEALGAFRGEIFVLKADGKHLELIALSGYDEAAQELIDARATLRLDQGLAGHVAQTRVAVAVPDVSCDPYWLPWPEIEDDTCSAACVPLLAGDTLVGVLSLLSQKEGFFTDDDLPLLQAVATPVALSLQNARLYEAEHHAYEVAEILRAANLALSETLDLDVILETLLEHLDQLVPYDTANAMLLEGKYLIMRALRGYEKWAQPQAAQKVVFDIETVPHLHELVNRQQSIIIPDTAEYAGWQPRQGIDHVRCWLGVPLTARGQVVGIFSLDKAEPNYFTQAHLKLVETLASQATIGIQNAYLFEQVHAGRERLRRLTKEVVSAQEEERQRVSRELHDEAGQALTALKISLDLAKASLPPELESARGSMIEAMELTDETMDRIRLLAQNLRPPALDTLGLNATLEGLCRDFAYRTNLLIKYKGVKLPPLPDAVNISFYRFVQEALTNVAKHANADKVQVVLDVEEEQVSVTISDNGQGFGVEEQTSLPPGSGGIGLIGMRERFELLGGRLEIESQADRGTRLIAHAPLL